MTNAAPNSHFHRSMVSVPSSIAAAERSYLFVPGNRPERFDKAWASAADAVILDLEDAVAPDQKDAARGAVRDALRADRPVWVRCNAVDTPWFEEDLALADLEGLQGLVLPKAEELPPALVRRVQARGLKVLALIETAEGLARCEDIARAPGVVRLAFGSIDFQADMGIASADEGLLAFRSRLVLASRLARLPAPVDGITESVDDDARIAADTLRAVALGFGARLCIHPRQIAGVHAAFAPSAPQRDWARRVVDAMRASGGQAVAVDGKMVDRPVLLRAQALLTAPLPDDCLRQRD